MLSSIAYTFDRWFTFNLKLLEQSALPLTDFENSTLKKICRYTMQFFQGLCAICMLGVTIPFKAMAFVIHSFGSKKTEVDSAVHSDTSLDFPKDFEFGIADSFFQSCGLGYTPSGQPQLSDWSEWMNTRFPDNTPHIEGDPDVSKFFINYLDHPEIIIKKLLEIGATSYRFSLERCVLEPVEGQFDSKYIEKYRAFLAKLKEHHIRPLITLHHFVNPLWFMKKGGFENEENIPGFVRYTEKMFECLGDLATDWVTLNELAISPFQGYGRGVYPPGVTDFSRFGQVLKNQLITHCRVYEAGKKKNAAFQIGFSHNWLIFQAYSSYNPAERVLAHYLSEITHHAVIRFFKTNTFSLQIPFCVNLQHHESGAKESFDFVGVQNYVRPVVEIGLFGVRSGLYPGEKMTNTGSRFSPENLEEVLQEASLLKKPIWITEIGSDVYQVEYYTKVFAIISRAIEQGVPIKKAFAWTTRSNFEWDKGDRADFGVCDGKFNNRPVVNTVIQPLYHQHRVKKTGSVPEPSLL